MCSLDMQHMTEDDAAYSALLARHLSDFVVSEEDHLPFTSSHSSIPSPSARHVCSIHRPDSLVLPRSSTDYPGYPSHDAFPHPSNTADDDNHFEKTKRLRALSVIVQEMTHRKYEASCSHTSGKPLPVPPPSPASPVTHSLPHAVRSRLPLARVSRPPTFTSTPPSDQSRPHEIPSQSPVSVIVYDDGCSHRHDDSFPHVFTHPQRRESRYLSPTKDGKDSVQPSPTLSNFSFASAQESSFTTPCSSTLASPDNAVFSSAQCSPENISLPVSPLDEDQPKFGESITALVHERIPLSRSFQSLVLPLKSKVFPTSPTSDVFPLGNTVLDHTRHYRSPELAQSQSRWSVATTALLPVAAQPRPSLIVGPRPPLEGKKGLKTSLMRTRFPRLLFRFFSSRTEPSSVTTSSQTGDGVRHNSTEEREKNKSRKSPSKKSSLASLRSSFSLSRISFSSRRPTISSSVGEVPPLPISPTLPSSMAGTFASPGVVLPKPQPLSKIESRGTFLDSASPPCPQSPSPISKFQSTSQFSTSDACIPPASDSCVSLVCTTTPPNASCISLPPAPRRRTPASTGGVQRRTQPSPRGPRLKDSRRLTEKPTRPIITGSEETATPSTSPTTDTNTPISTPIATHPRIPPASTQFNPPAKLTAVIVAQSRQVPHRDMSQIPRAGSTSPSTFLEMTDARIGSQCSRREYQRFLERPAVS